MNIAKEFNKKLSETPHQFDILNSCSSPAIGGCSATFYQDHEDDTVYVVLDDEYFRIMGIVPENYASQASAIDYDPYDSAAYTRSSVYLACSALSHALYHQTERQRKARLGGYSTNIRF